jgi:hypothetical protein
VDLVPSLARRPAEPKTKRHYLLEVQRQTIIDRQIRLGEGNENESFGSLYFFGYCSLYLG